MVSLRAGHGVILLHAIDNNAHMLMQALGHRRYTVHHVGLLPGDVLNFLENATFLAFDAPPFGSLQ